ncbi:MAG: hypothetical protein U0L02_00805 [Kandleria vitulina]|jgi:hypothetical protein|uniref:hypothetical protein n=1 Tax=Kandleria vitulina TaxID=1630 RepID=UPI00183E6A9F|nr:hypothetical protein [Kandleria vitulina]MEE0987883.1 hypothetical protein [Kandleria vitulina]HIH35301.1 hypothetical protein [Methanosphaera sp.]
MKRTFIVVVSILILTGCSIPESQSTHIDYTFGVVETSSPRKYTRFRFYDINGKEVATRKISEAEVGSSFNTVCYKNNYAYFTNTGLQGKKNPKSVIRLKGNSTEVKAIRLPRINIGAVAADDQYYYGVSNANYCNYLTQMNAHQVKRREVKEQKRLSFMVAASHHKVFNFVAVDHDVTCDIYDQNLKLLKSIPLAKYGSNILKYCLYKDKLYFSFSGENGFIARINMKTYKLAVMRTPYSYPDNIFVRNGKLYVTFYDVVLCQGNTVGVFDEKNMKFEKSYQLRYSPDMIDYHEKNAYVLTRDKKDRYSISIVDYQNGFKVKKHFSLPYTKTKGYLIYYSTLFINPKLKS